MIKKILTYYTERLDEFLNDQFPQPEGVVELSFIGNSSDGKKNKLLVSLLGIEREGAIGIVSTKNGRLGSESKGFPALHMNLNIIFAAVYDEKRYAESLSVLSSTLLFIQALPSFTYEKVTYAIEVISPSSQELNNVWTSLGGQYYPSVLCKLKGVSFDAQEVKQIGRKVVRPIIDM